MDQRPHPVIDLVTSGVDLLNPTEAKGVTLEGDGSTPFSRAGGGRLPIRQNEVAS
jgi:hypothetical protein